ncbi:MAG: DNA polymerase IV [Chloroflexi bacterium]|nr:DNA polymerase IV [Chloroflexota bacterium]MBM3153922.1 DNA polymerase IV [Chloroflexota bacterium]MBM3172971.1 DNA polymerase IV [Chloroflexota bacterium]MBM3175278.1 DNA polymerase IV [Chloroflexota bacterium]MBM4450073.1 DNA polymerase IV [Chloroflexota bacterium]
MTRHILHIDLDAFFVSVEQVLVPELAGKPVIVGGRPDRRGVVASASYEARAYGVRAAMPLTQAYRLCPQAIFLQGDFKKYRDFSARFMNILADFSPSLEPGGLDEAYLDVTGCDIFGTPLQIAKKIKERVRKELGLIASVGIAPSKVVAKVASDLGKPDGLIEVPIGGEKSFLAPLPVARLPGVGGKTEQTLVVMGIKTIGQLADLPQELLKGRFGTFGAMLHEHANGIDESRVEVYGEVKSISRETTLERDTLDSQFLEGMLRHLSEKVGADLRYEGKRARSVILKLRYSDFETITRRFTPKESLASDEAIFVEAVRLLKQALAKKRKPVRLIGVGVSNLVGEARQLTMFDQASRRLELLDKTIDRIRRKYGFAAIQTGRTFALKDIFSRGGED